MPRTISRNEARKYYDWFGAKQDWQGFYEDGALDRLIELGRFTEAARILEIGCGTGRLAVRLLSDCLPASARYVGVELSATMADLARKRLARFENRCEVHRTDGGFDYAAYGAPFDRIVTTYVLDLLSPADIRNCLSAAHAMLSEGGLFCHAGLTVGTGPVSRTTSAIWKSVHRLRPILVGGCRPLELAELVPDGGWRLIHRETVISAAIPSEVVILQKYGDVSARSATLA